PAGGHRGLLRPRPRDDGRPREADQPVRRSHVGERTRTPGTAATPPSCRLPRMPFNERTPAPEKRLMRITRVDSQLLHVPTSPPRSSPAEVKAGRSSHVVLLVVRLETDGGLTGLGVAYVLQGSGRGLHAVAADDLAPLVLGEDPLDNERLAAKVYLRLQSVGRRGLVAEAYSAFDLACGDLRGKAANLPLFKLLGGARESAQVYGSDTAWVWMTPDQIVEQSRPYLAQGVGIKVKVGANAE